MVSIWKAASFAYISLLIECSMNVKCQIVVHSAPDADFISFNPILKKHLRRRLLSWQLTQVEISDGMAGGVRADHRVRLAR